VKDNSDDNNTTIFLALPDFCSSEADGMEVAAPNMLPKKKCCQIYFATCVWVCVVCERVANSIHYFSDYRLALIKKKQIRKT